MATSHRVVVREVLLALIVALIIVLSIMAMYYIGSSRLSNAYSLLVWLTSILALLLLTRFYLRESAA